MSTRIVWMSRHPPTPKQLASLECLFPHYELIIDAHSFDSADDIIERFRAAHGDEMVVVAPLTVIRELVSRGLHPLYAEMKAIPCHAPNVEVRTKHRCYKFVRFRRVDGVDLRLSPIHPLEPIDPTLDPTLEKETTIT